MFDLINKKVKEVFSHLKEGLGVLDTSGASDFALPGRTMLKDSGLGLLKIDGWM